MSFRINKENGLLIVTVNEKRATVDIADKLKQELNRHFSDGADNVIVDLSAVEFIDSSFLGVLVAGLKKATLVNGDLKICGLQPQVENIFELTRLYQIYDIFDSLEEAKSSF